MAVNLAGEGKRRQGLQQGEKFLDRHSRVADEGAKGSHGQLFVLGDRKIDADAGLGHHEMASHLADGLPSGFLKSLGCFLTGDVGEPPHAARP